MGKKIDKFLDMMDLKNHTERLYSSLKLFLLEAFLYRYLQMWSCTFASYQRGNVHYNYDTKFIFAEVNADQVYWQKKVDSKGKEDWAAVRIKTDAVG